MKKLFLIPAILAAASLMAGCASPADKERTDTTAAPMNRQRSSPAPAVSTAPETVDEENISPPTDLPPAPPAPPVKAVE